MREIRSILHLNDDDALLLQTYLYPELTESLLSQQPDYNTYAKTIFMRSPSAEIAANHYTIEYMDNAGTTSMYSPAELALIISTAGTDRQEDPLDLSARTEHVYDVTIYNCLSAEQSGGIEHVPSKSILTIARLLMALDRQHSETQTVRTHVRQYLNESFRNKMNDHDPANIEDMCFNFNLLNDVLPLLSVAEDYHIDTAGVMRHFWTEQTNLCLIKHSFRTARAASAAVDGAGQDLPKYGVEYFVLIFSKSGECSACRLGSDQARHIFRFLALDIRDKRKGVDEKSASSNPNQAYSEYAQNLRIALIHPDLCFDDIPREMWYALFTIVESSDNKALFETAFRGLMDPHSQYDFLDFESLVRLAVDTLEQRYAANCRNGKIVICHPEGLYNLVRTGLITDLQGEGIDYKGQGDLAAPLRFPTFLTKKLLELVRESIVRRQNSEIKDPSQYDWVNYYILHPQYPYPEITYGVYREFGVFSYYTKSRHRHVNTNAFPNPAIGTAMYDYIVREMVGKRGQKIDSDILSDEHSIALIDKLIRELDKEIS